MKTMTPNRICLKVRGDVVVVYCSSVITREVRELCVRLNQMLHPSKSGSKELSKRLQELAKELPNEFSNTSRLLLLYGAQVEAEMAKQFEAGNLT